MRLSGEQMWELLRQLDDPDHLERPADFDVTVTRDKFERLVTALDASFGGYEEADRDVQDASLHARVAVPAARTATGERLVVCVSNFGDLATVSVVNPGAFDQEEHDALLDPADAGRVHAVLDDLGYVVVPEAPLWRDYDGPSRLSVLSDPQPTWWLRFFDYL